MQKKSFFFELQPHSQKEGRGLIEKLSATLFGLWNVGPSASVTPIAGSHCRSRKMITKLLSAQNKCVIVVVVVVFVVVVFDVVIFASHCLVIVVVGLSDRQADHGSVGVVELAGGTVLCWSAIHPHLLTCDETDRQNGWTGGWSRRLKEMRSCIWQKILIKKLLVSKYINIDTNIDTINFTWSLSSKSTYHFQPYIQPLLSWTWRNHLSDKEDGVIRYFSWLDTRQTDKQVVFWQQKGICISPRMTPTWAHMN